MLKRLRDFFCLNADEWKSLCEFSITAAIVLTIVTLLVILLAWWYYIGGF